MKLIMKNNNGIHRDRKQPRKHVYVYHWDRIIGAGIVILVLVGLAGYGLSLWSDSSPKEEIDTTDTLPKATKEEGLPSAVAEITDSSSNSRNTQTPPLNKAITAEDNPAPQFAEDKPLETEPSSPEIAKSLTAAHGNEETVKETSVNEKDLEDSELADVAHISEEMPAIPAQAELSEPKAEIPQNMQTQEESPDSADTKLAVDTLNRPFQLKKLKILEPSVKRFLLAGSISNREPEGELNKISFTADGSAAVWAFSEVIDKKGSRFKYVWLHGGNQIATVPVYIGSNRWRSYSSKIINQSMIGAWRVELQDGEGRLMAGADFFLK